MYTPIKLHISNDQHEKLKNAIREQKGVAIKIALTRADTDHIILLTRVQIERVERARLIGKSVLNIYLSKKQVKANVQHEGGFLSMLAGLAARALPTLIGLASKALPHILGGLTTGLVSGAVDKAVFGNGLYLHKLGHCVKIDRTKGNGLRLSPRPRLYGVAGDGFYFKRGASIYEGSGLLLGPNSPFKNIPIINLLL